MVLHFVELLNVVPWNVAANTIYYPSPRCQTVPYKFSMWQASNMTHTQSHLPPPEYWKLGWMLVTCVICAPSFLFTDKWALGPSQINAAMVTPTSCSLSKHRCIRLARSAPEICAMKYIHMEPSSTCVSRRPWMPKPYIPVDCKHHCHLCLSPGLHGPRSSCQPIPHACGSITITFHMLRKQMTWPL